MYSDRPNRKPIGVFRIQINIIIFFVDYHQRAEIELDPKVNLTLDSPRHPCHSVEQISILVNSVLVLPCEIRHTEHNIPMEIKSMPECRAEE